MKKKAPSKMKLSRETLRDLNDDQAREAAAGLLTQTCSNTKATCYTCGADPGVIGTRPAAFCA
ncbi:MAG TPA: hypothetical protein VFE33_25935 [Thermoanaerobaculia bacterium]|nr:hypothetical protein [Thermoanaerobaculia bacterium]